MQSLEKQLSKLEKISFGTITVADVVGKGRFKRVHKGRYKGRDVVVLRYAKDLSRGFSPSRQRPGSPTEAKTEDERDKNYNELRILSLLAKKGSETFVPEIFGVCHEPHSTIIVQEFAQWGTLKSLLQSSSLKTLASNLHRLHCAHQISQAMGFLESEHVVHADLSCRNVLVFRFEDAPHLTIGKVSDFGLSVVLKEGTDHVFKRQPQATRWCPPETVLDSKLSHRGDMWSLGVTVWEMYADGTTPWPLRQKRAEVANRLKDIADTGGSAEGGPSVDNDFPRGPVCPPVVHAVLMSCLRADEYSRPSFEQLTTTIGRIIEEGGEMDSQAEALITASIADATARGPGKRPSRVQNTKDFVLPVREELPEPDTPQWHALCASAEVDETVAARVQALRAFPEEERELLLAAEGILERQIERVAVLRREALAKHELGKAGAIVASASHTPVTPRIQGPFLGACSSVCSTPKRAAVIRTESARQIALSPSGAWVLWYIQGKDMHNREFLREVDAWEAYKWTRRLGLPCTLRDPSGIELANDTWNAATGVFKEGSMTAPTCQRVFCVTPPRRSLAPSVPVVTSTAVAKPMSAPIGSPSCSVVTPQMACAAAANIPATAVTRVMHPALQCW